jgi:hypothetical protein
VPGREAGVQRGQGGEVHAGLRSRQT